MAEATVDMVDAVKTKLKELMKPPWLDNDVDSRFDIDSIFDIKVDDVLTYELGALKNSEAVALKGEGTLFACDIGNETRPTKYFFELTNMIHSLYIREGYSELYEDIKVKWGEGVTHNVILSGNAGSGKSWYQLYVIRRLLQRELQTGEHGNSEPGREEEGSEEGEDKDEYDFIFRQVGPQVYLIDIKACRGYRIKLLDTSRLKYLVRCLYFFEPGDERDLVPRDYGIPSLLTLSPYEDRVKEIKKKYAVTLYFWPWSFTELKMMIDHRNERNEKVKIGFDDFCANFKYFGGIVRHYLAHADTQAAQKEELKARVKNDLDLETLQKKVVNIDRAKGDNNISGDILCYDGKREALEARKRDEVEKTQGVYFNKRILRYTSDYVEEEAAKIIDKRPMEEKMEIVLDRLDHQNVDLSGKNLEEVATEFLKDGKVQWEKTKAGSRVWNSFKPGSRDVVKQYDISSLSTRRGELLVPVNTSFPVADMVFSGWHNDDNSPVDVFQCTWQPTHPFTIRALYMLRVKHLAIENHKKLRVFILSPEHEESYSQMTQRSFLDGSIDEPLKYTNRLTVAAESLKAMWESTDVYILRPQQGWKKLIGDYLLPTPDIQSQQAMASSKRDAADMKDGEEGQKPAAKKSKTK